MAHYEATKNHPCRVEDIQSSEKFARMYKVQSSDDGYTAMKLYIEKLNPKCEVFFQYSKKDKHVGSYFKELHDKCVLVPADKAGNNIIFVCKRFYIKIYTNR